MNINLVKYYSECIVSYMSYIYDAISAIFSYNAAYSYYPFLTPLLVFSLKKNRARRKCFVSCVACSTVTQISYSVSFQYANKTDEGNRPVSRTYGARIASAFSKKNDSSKLE